MKIKTGNEWLITWIDEVAYDPRMQQRFFYKEKSSGTKSDRTRVELSWKVNERVK